MIRLGIVGCGNVAEQYAMHAERLRARGWCELVAACGRPRQRDFALGTLGARVFHEDHRQLISSPEVDVVIILTPPRDHAALVRAALLAGKHVLVEKPLATTLEDARELLELARRGPGHLVPAPFTTLSPTFGELRRRIDAGEIGEPLLARGRYGWAGPWWSSWFYEPGGGALFDLGVYNIITLTGLLGPARRVSAVTGAAIPERLIEGRRVRVTAEDNAHVVIEHAGGALSVITTGFTLQQYRSPAVEIHGTRGTIQMLGDDWDPDGFEVRRGGSGPWRIFKETVPEWPWTDGLRHLLECLREGTPPRVRPEHAHHALEIILAARAASTDGRARPVESTFTLPHTDTPGAAEPAHLLHDRTRAT